jgi:hypothetical protein
MTINAMQSAHDAPRCNAKSKRTALSCACGSRLSRLSDAWGPRRRADRQAEWQLSARHAHKRGDPSSQVRQFAVALGT